MSIKDKIRHRNNQENLQKCKDRIDMLTKKLENIGVDSDIDAKLKYVSKEKSAFLILLVTNQIGKYNKNLLPLERKETNFKVVCQY